jgi:hypothetical protein
MTEAGRLATVEVSDPTTAPGDIMTRVCIDIDNDGGNGSVPVVKTYETTIGDGSQLDFPIDHNLGQRIVIVSPYDQATGALRSDADITFVNENRALVRFDTPPPAQSVRVLVLAVRPASV